jgi:hypothetical protein
MPARDQARQVGELDAIADVDESALAESGHSRKRNAEVKALHQSLKLPEQPHHSPPLVRCIVSVSIRSAPFHFVAAAAAQQHLATWEWSPTDGRRLTERSQSHLSFPAMSTYPDEESGAAPRAVS